MRITFKNTVSAMVASLTMCFAMADDIPAGKAQFKKIKSNQYIVTQEVDSVFTSWTNGNQVAFKADTNNFYIGGKSVAQLLEEKSENDPIFDRFQSSENRIQVGSGTSASVQKGLAMGVPAISDRGKDGITILYSKDGTRSYWKNDYIGDVYADRESVALGDSAFAGNPVSVAIGDQAIVGNLHTDSGQMFGVPFDRMEVTTIISGGTTTVTTNVTKNAYTNYYDIAKYEKLPGPGDWKKVVSGTPVVEGGTTNITDVYEQKQSGALSDISYVSQEDWEMYDRIISGGQGDVPLFDAYYGIAIGSRAYVFGYHSVAFGHYAHASRPFASAFGSESHVYSEGSQAFGYDTDIPNTSPYSLAIGANASIGPGMTNAIVIGVPQVVDFTNLTYRSEEGMVKDRPMAVKSNSINFAYHGDGIQDFFLDGVSLQDRLSSEVNVIGNGKLNASEEGVKNTLGITGDNIVFASGDGKIMFFTKSYIEEQDDSNVHLDEIVINNKPLSQILAEQAPSGGADTEFRAKVQDAAEVAQNELATNATNMVQVKAILTNFFNTIKQ